MGPKALKLWKSNVTSIKFFKSLNELHQAVQEWHEKHGRPRSDEGMQGGATIKQPGGKSEHWLNGGKGTAGNEDQAEAQSTAKYYAHEFAHAVINATGFHATDQWQRPAQQDREFIYEKTAMGRSTDKPDEAFCDFAVAAWLAPGKAQEKAPHAWAQLRHWELVP